MAPDSPHIVKPTEINEASGPMFVNAQVSPVGVYTPTRKKVYVQPFRDRLNTDTEVPSTRADRLFVVRGNHYQQYAGQGGPLTYFPGSEDTAADRKAALGNPGTRRPLHASATARIPATIAAMPPTAVPSNRPLPAHASTVASVAPRSVPVAAPAEAEEAAAPAASDVVGDPVKVVDATDEDEGVDPATLGVAPAPGSVKRAENRIAGRTLAKR